MSRRTSGAVLMRSANERLPDVSCGSDSESLAASKSSPLVLKQPTYAMILQKDRVGPKGNIAALAWIETGRQQRAHLDVIFFSS
jgi:hypothetical protein